MATIVTKTVKASGGDYTSLVAWQSGEHKDLVAADEIAQAEVYASVSPAADMPIDGWTTDATRYIRIYTPTSERHAGTWDAAKFKWVTTNQRILETDEDYVRLDGLQCQTTATVSTIQMRSFNSASNEFRIENCIFKMIISGAGVEGYGLLPLTNTHIRVRNCIFYDFMNTTAPSTFGAAYYGGGAHLSGRFYNCTVHNSRIGFYSDAASVDMLKNCLTQDCTDGFTTGYHANSTNNCSDIASDAPGSNPQTGSVTFVNEAGDDFHLSTSDTVAKKHGIDLSADADGYAFSDDIDGHTRVTWDIGADELVRTLLTDLIAYYPLDEASGNAIDQHGTHDGVEGGTVGTFTPGKLDTTARFLDAASTEYFGVPDDAELDFTTQLTVSGWLRMDNSITQMCMIAKWNYPGSATTNSSWVFQNSPNLPGSGAFRVFIANGSDGGNNFANYDSTSLANDTWYYATMVYDGTLAEADRVKVYLNASLMTVSGKTGTWVATLQVSAAEMRLGSFQGLPLRHWQGQLQGWGVWGRALAASEVSQLYNGGAGLPYEDFTPSTPGALSGSTSITFGATGTMKGAGAMSGSTSISFGATGTMKGAGRLSGTTTLTFGQAGILKGAGRLSGTTTLTFGQAGILKGAGRLSGTTTITFATTGTLTPPSGAMSGSTSITFSGVGILKGAGRLSGTTTITFGATGTFLVPGALSGSTSITFASSGTMSGTGALSGTTGIIFAATITVSTTVVWTSYGTVFYYEEINWGTRQFALEVFFKATVGTVYARLYNRTDAAEVADTQVETDTVSYVRERAPAVSLTDAKEYEVQFGKVTGAGEWKSAKLIAL